MSRTELAVHIQVKKGELIIISVQANLQPNVWKLRIVSRYLNTSKWSKYTRHKDIYKWHKHKNISTKCHRRGGKRPSLHVISERCELYLFIYEQGANEAAFSAGTWRRPQRLAVIKFSSFSNHWSLTKTEFLISKLKNRCLHCLKLHAMSCLVHHLNEGA